MVWNTGKSILGTGDRREDMEREADVIFTAAFIGMTLFQNEKKQGLTWRVDIEPNSDLGKETPLFPSTRTRTSLGIPTG